ncbi:MAG: NAD(P)/FAD-dependent oxidoreductase [Muribaculaceae bacterium]|nr:NAD(P)/FAD-dependent oxidoreductase [Muribaculaceae bacterium]
MSEKVVILGGGLGGLFTGALLAREGYTVTVIEKNRTLGGGLQMFSRHGTLFETGMHMLGGLRPGDSIRKICDYLGITSQLDIMPTDHDCMDSITYLSDGKTYRIPEGKDNFVDYFSKQFPHQAINIKAYVDKLYALTEEVDFFYLRHETGSIFNHSEEFIWPANKLIAHYIDDERLQDVLAYMNPMYGGVENRTPAFVHALINVLYINGTDRFAGGSQQLATALVGVITNHGGEVLTDEKVTQIEVDDNKLVKKVTTNKNREFSGDIYVAAFHPCALLDIIDPHAFNKAYKDRIMNAPNSYSTFSVFISFKPETFPYINHTCYFQDDYGSVWSHGDYDAATWPRGFMYMTSPEHNQGKWATKMIVNSIMKFDQVEQWSNTTTGHRGDSYEQWKEKHIAMVLRRLEQLHPGIGACIDHITASSPLTIRDYFNVKDGAIYGFSKDCNNLALTQLSIFTKVKNFYLTGQCINLHGICGVPLTAVNTVEAIERSHDIIDRINNHYQMLTNS